MRRHFEDYWPGYVLFFAIGLPFIALVAAANHDERRSADCLEQGEIYVRVDNTPYCVIPTALRRIK